MPAPKKKSAAKKAKAPVPEACDLGPYAAEPRSLPEGIDFEENVIATYYVSFPKELDVVALAPVLARPAPTPGRGCHSGEIRWRPQFPGPIA